MTTKIIAGVATLAALIAMAIGAGQIETQDPDPLKSGSSKSPPTFPIVVDHLCDYDDGLYCEPCATCPQESSGWLCCSPRNACTVYTAGGCNGDGNVKGYCNNYSTDAATGNVTCHDT